MLKQILKALVVGWITKKLLGRRDRRQGDYRA